MLLLFNRQGLSVAGKSLIAPIFFMSSVNKVGLYFDLIPDTVYNGKKSIGNGGNDKMRLGLNAVPAHRTPEEWADILAAKGYRAASFPVNYKASVSVIDAYVKAAHERDIMIAEVGVWNSPHHPAPEEARLAREACLEQFRLADYVRAECCVNVSGAAGTVWYGCYGDNYSPKLYEENVEFIRSLCDTVKPEYTCYALEPMQWMLPDSPEQYLQFVKDVDRESFAVHMDMVNFIKDPWNYTHQEELADRTFSLLGSRIRSCHLKDCLMESGTTVAIHEVPAGEGCVDLGMYLRHIADLDRDLPVLLEHLPDMETYDRALAHVKGLKY